jgi:signal peptidase I
MGKMKEIFIEICNANNGELPQDITTGDVIVMKELEIYNWKEYEAYVKKKKNSYSEDELKLVAEAKKLKKQKENQPF